MDKHTGHQIVAATNNAHKLSEIRPLLEPDFRILSLQDIGCAEELPETAETIEGNSLQKASYVFERYHLPCFADDTGLEVEALNGEPGVYSARYAGSQRNSADNMALVLQKLAGQTNRRARFKTIITLIGFGGVKSFEGIIEGVLVSETRGNGGFGYDPIFQPDGSSQTLAEMTLTEKNRISHRAIAIKKLVAFLRAYKTDD